MSQNVRDKNKIRELIDQLLPFIYDEDENVKRHAIGLKKNLERILTEQKDAGEDNIKIINGVKYKRVD